MNFKRILSNSTSASSSSSRKNLMQSETEICRLQRELELHKQSTEFLKISLENRDAAIGILARDKEQLYTQLKNAQGINRNLRQQLDEESTSASSSSSRKNLMQSETEICRLQRELELHKQSTEFLKISLENRDAAIGILARDKEQLYTQLKNAQGINRNLRQQLDEEREINTKEKNYLIAEIQRLLKATEPGNIDQNLNLDKNISTHRMSFTELKEKDEVICNICEKYLKIKSNKSLLEKKLKNIQSQYQKACETVILLLQKNKKRLDNLLKKLIESSETSINNKKYSKLLRINANLFYENTQLKILLSSNYDFINQNGNTHVGETERNPKLSILKKFRKDKNHLFLFQIYNKARNNVYLTTPLKLPQKCKSDSCLTQF